MISCRKGPIIVRSAISPRATIGGDPGAGQSVDSTSRAPDRCLSASASGPGSDKRSMALAAFVRSALGSLACALVATSKSASGAKILQNISPAFFLQWRSQAVTTSLRKPPLDSSARSANGVRDVNARLMRSA